VRAEKLYPQFEKELIKLLSSSTNEKIRVGYKVKMEHMDMLTMWDNRAFLRMVVKFLGEDPSSFEGRRYDDGLLPLINGEGERLKEKLKTCGKTKF
jgi:hypothetical protein